MFELRQNGFTASKGNAYCTSYQPWQHPGPGEHHDVGHDVVKLNPEEDCGETHFVALII